MLYGPKKGSRVKGARKTYVPKPGDGGGNYQLSTARRQGGDARPSRGESRRRYRQAIRRAKKRAANEFMRPDSRHNA